MNTRYSFVRIGRLTCLTLCVWFMFVLRAQAQMITYDGCVNALGDLVASIPNDELGDVARAFLAPNGEPVIEYNPSVLAVYSEQSRLFWYAHECGHHALGHHFGTAHPLSAEQQADCFGIVSIVGDNLIDLDDVPMIQADLGRYSRGDWSHLPGSRRAINLTGCLREAGLLRPNRGENSCEYANDGECDEPDLCDPGTDTADCRRTRSSPNSGPLYCCDIYGNRYCEIVVNPGPIGSACFCSGLPGSGLMCQ